MARSRNPALASVFRDQFAKTRLCRFYASGKCQKDGKCPFAHEQEELQVAPDLIKTSVCTAWQHGACAKSSEDCPFAHGIEELRGSLAFREALRSRRSRKRGKRGDSANQTSEPLDDDCFVGEGFERSVSVNTDMSQDSYRFDELTFERSITAPPTSASVSTNMRSPPDFCVSNGSKPSQQNFVDMNKSDGFEDASFQRQMSDGFENASFQRQVSCPTASARFIYCIPVPLNKPMTPESKPTVPNPVNPSLGLLPPVWYNEFIPLLGARLKDHMRKNPQSIESCKAELPNKIVQLLKDAEPTAYED